MTHKAQDCRNHQPDFNEMSRTDVRTVDRSSLVDIASVQVDSSLPLFDRLTDFIQQIKNPYCYLCNGVTVKISFAGKCTLESAIQSALQVTAPVPAPVPVEERPAPAAAVPAETTNAESITEAA